MDQCIRILNKSHGPMYTNIEKITWTNA